MCPTNFSNYTQCSTSPMGKFSLQFSVTKYRLDGMQAKFLPFLNTTFYLISVRSIRVVLFFNMKIASSFIYTWACRLGDIVAFSRYWNFSEKQYVVLELSRSIFGSQVNRMVGETNFAVGSCSFGHTFSWQQLIEVDEHFECYFPSVDEFFSSKTWLAFWTIIDRIRISKFRWRFILVNSIWMVISLKSRDDDHSQIFELLLFLSYTCSSYSLINYHINKMAPHILTAWFFCKFVLSISTLAYSLEQSGCGRSLGVRDAEKRLLSL